METVLLCTRTSFRKKCLPGMKIKYNNTIESKRNGLLGIRQEISFSRLCLDSEPIESVKSIV